MIDPYFFHFLTIGGTRPVRRSKIIGGGVTKFLKLRRRLKSAEDSRPAAAFGARKIDGGSAGAKKMQ